MKAAILKAPGVLELDDMPDPECPKGGALIKVLACAVCGTDVKMLKDGHKDLAYPCILGHEIVGRLVEIDRDCGLEIGDMVQVWPGIACGRCRPCQREENNRCQKMKILGFNQDGGFAELMALPSQCIPNGLNSLPEKTDPGIAALAEPLACCINGQTMARVSKGDSVLIYGAGPLGCLHALLAKHHGAEKIIVAEKLANRIEKIKRHTGVTAIGPDESLKQVLNDETGGAGVDIILTATPEVRVDSSLLKLLAPGGRICIFSGPKSGNYEEQIDLRSLHYRELTINGTYGCSSQQNRKAVDLLISGEIKTDWIITKRTNLADIHDALSHSSSKSGLKSIICGR
jgi:L-iditol 2-dehydrogenase